ncbi:MAG: hypothetical protein JJE34_06835 [Alphaproteobacteria bacterium]|nr:hypothetical protein [Alphaproteobacteria bacterium]
MNPNISMSLSRADEILLELKQEYEKSLQQHSVSDRAVHYTHEVSERLRSVLDRLARAYWERHIAISLTADERARAHVYFPITNDQNSFDSMMGRWRWKALAERHSDLRNYLLSLQPFSKPENAWIRIINDLALQSKHIDLVPQKRIEERRVTVSRGGGGSVSWGPGVTFGSGVNVMGAPVDPRTQRIIPTAGVSEKIEIWVSFAIDGYGVNALSLCTDACKNVRDIADYMTKEFSL